MIVATRPLLLSTLMERLSTLDSNNEDTESSLDLTKTLITAGIKSASKTLQIISNSDSLLGTSSLAQLLSERAFADSIPEVFLLYNLEFTYAAAIHLAMANALYPDAVDGPASSQEAHSILDQMISNGNKVAQVRKEELVHVEGLFLEVAARAESNGLQPLTLATTVNVEKRTADQRRSNSAEDPQINRDEDGGFVGHFAPIELANPGYGDSPYQANMMMPSTELLDDIGISSAEFLAIVDQIGNPGASYSILDLGQ